jgi:uncharacterized RDD family membrane protein YckC
VDEVAVYLHALAARGTQLGAAALGKKLLNIRVVRVNGCLHDLLADTVVVRAE